MIEIGDIVPFTVTVRAAPVAPATVGALVDPVGGVASVVLTVTLPDGTTSTPTVTRTSIGLFAAQFVVTMDGVHSYRWVVTDPTNGNTFGPEPFVVEDSAYIPFVSLDEQLEFMRARNVIVSTSELEELRRLIRISCTSVELDLGRAVSVQTLTKTIDGGSVAVVLPGPVISMTSVTEAGVALTAGTQYVLDTSAGILYRGSSSAPRSFASGIQNVTMVYRAGRRNPWPVVRKVANNGALRMWQGVAQMPHPALDDLDVEQQVAAGVLTPLEYSAYLKIKAGGFA